MSEDPQDPKTINPSGDSARGAEPSQPADPMLPGDVAQGEDAPLPTSGESIDSPLKRLTGALRGDNIPPEKTPRGGSLPPVQPSSGLPSAEPGTPAASPLFAPGENPDDLFEQRESSEAPGGQPERVTGVLRSTRPLSEDDLRGLESAEKAGGGEPTQGMPAGEGEGQPREEPGPAAAQGTGSLLERLTGTLRQATNALHRPDAGSLHPAYLPKDTGSLRGKTEPLQEPDLPEEPHPAPRVEAPPWADLSSMRDDLSLEDNAPLLESNGPLSESGEPAGGAEPPSAGAPLPQDADTGPVRGAGPMRDADYLHGTRPLSEDDLRDLNGATPEAEAPAEPRQPVMESRPEIPRATPDQPGSLLSEGRLERHEEALVLPKAGTGSLLERLTGTLRRTTGELLGTGSLRRTGQLREPGAKEGEGGAKPRPAVDESLNELRQALTSEEAERIKKSRGTGRLFERITGSLRKVTGSLRKTDKLRGQSAAEANAAMPDAAVSDEDGSSAEMTLPDMPEIGDDMLSGRLAGAEAVAPREPMLPDAPADWSGSPWFTGITEVEPAQAEEEAPGGPLFTEEEPGIDWEAGALKVPRWLSEGESETGNTPEAPDLSEPLLNGDEPIALLDSGAIAALEQAEAAERQAGEPDWISEIRHEVAEEEEASAVEVDEKPRRKGMTGQLRSFISGILRGGEDKGKAAASEGVAASAETEAAEAEVTETPATQSNEEWQAYIAAAASGQLGLAQDEGLFGEEAQTADGEPPAGEAQPAGEALPEGEQPLVDELPAASQMDEDAFAARFGVLGETVEQPDETANPYRLSPEEEALLWGAPETSESLDADQVTLPTPEELWEEPQPDEEEAEPLAPDLRNPQDDIDSFTLRNTERVASSLFGDVTEESYTAAYLAGEELKPAEAPPPAQDNLLRQALGRSDTPPEGESIETIRAIALENYEEVAESGAVETEAQVYQVPVELVPMAVTPAEQEALGLSEPEPVKQSWWAARSLAEKVLIIEAASVALALLIAIPVYTFLVINRIQARQAASAGAVAPISLIRPTPLPAELPHPTGIVLPGGWYFALSNSTFVKGEWKPVSSEWKEDTELRRVVALPWNPQTDAVIRTFKPGDRVQVDLSNNKSQLYKIEEIKRVPITDTTVLAANKPSLAIILYNENATERWVVLCKP